VLRETVAARNSSGGRFVSIRLSFHAEDRARYEAAHAALRAEPDVKWTL
jgi:putative lipoic acid-binding regulatory protein